MTRLHGFTAALVLGLVASAPARAQQAPAAPAAPSGAPSGAPDMTKMGPLSRPVTKEDKKGIDALYTAMEEAWKKGDVEAVADNVDFPVIMLSDTSAGVAKSFNATREQFIALMKPMAAGMPKDAKMSHKHTPYFLSDTLAVAIEENGLTMGKTKGKWKGMSVLTLKDGRWKVKEMAEAGWGDMNPPSMAATPSKTPTNTVPPIRK
jgi:uncharacterized protein (TIGR02246 family)